MAAAQVLGDMPQKTFEFQRQREPTAPLALPGGETPQAALARVLALPAVGSKRFLTTKADRSVTGAPAAAPKPKLKPKPKPTPKPKWTLSLIIHRRACWRWRSRSRF